MYGFGRQMGSLNFRRGKQGGLISKASCLEEVDNQNCLEEAEDS